MSALHKQALVLASNHLLNAKSPLFVVLGPTASGKTVFSINLALHLKNAEVVNADSRQFYRYMDIGTAKITNEDMNGIPHHLIDVLNPDEASSAGWFQSKAIWIINDIISRGKIPILVGGSMLYISSIVDGLSMAPSTSPEIRNRYIKEYEMDGGKTLYNRLCEIDPETAKNIHPNNMPHLIRALEIYELTNLPKSSVVPNLQLRSGNNVTKYDSLFFGMHVDRKDLINIINNRTKAMINAGWLDEVNKLISMGYKIDDPGMKSHGYREIYYFVENQKSSSIDDLISVISAKSRQYAKRQMTWWRGDRRINWIDICSKKIIAIK